jgi:hypothetical protein
VRRARVAATIAHPRAHREIGGQIPGRALLCSGAYQHPAIGAALHPDEGSALRVPGHVLEAHLISQAGGCDRAGPQAISQRLFHGGTSIIAMSLRARSGQSHRARMNASRQSVYPIGYWGRTLLASRPARIAGYLTGQDAMSPPITSPSISYAPYAAFDPDFLQAPAFETFTGISYSMVDLRLH